MVGIPEDVNVWTYSTVLQLATDHSGEPGWFDFKAGLTDTTRSIRKTAVAMANTDGGYIIFGVTDIALSTTSEGRIKGIPNNSEFGRDLGEIVKVVKPPLRFEVRRQPIALPSDDKRGIIPVAVPRSQTTGHAVPSKDDGGWTFYRRGDGGQAVPLDYYEVRTQVLYGAERLMKVDLLRFELRDYQERLDAIRASGRAAAERFDNPTPLKTLVVELAGILPRQSELLIDLYSLGRFAGRINTILNNYATHGSLTGYEGALLDPSTSEMHNIINRCHQRLNALFGPFLSGGILS